MILAGMLGVSAMAAQNALVRISLPEAPSTAVMTTNMTLFALDLGEMVLTRDSIAISKARRHAKRTAWVLVGFLLGCALGAASEAAAGLHAMVLPVVLALVAAAIGTAADTNRVCSSNHKEISR